MNFDFTPIPTKTVVMNDIPALLEILKAKGSLMVAPETNINPLHVALHKHGYGTHQVKINNEVVAYNIAPLRWKCKERKGAEA